MTHKSFWIHISRDYRSGTEVSTYTSPPKNEVEDSDKETEDSEDSDEECTPEDASEIVLEVPKFADYRLYLINEFPTYQPIWHADLSSKKDYVRLYLKLFSQLHDCLPFVVTGWTSSYKEEGHYPDVPDDIAALPDVPEIEAVRNDADGYYVVVVIDSDGDEIMSRPLQPHM